MNKRYIMMTQSNEIRRLSKKEYSLLGTLTRTANDLYNKALEETRQYYKKTSKNLAYTNPTTYFTYPFILKNDNHSSGG